MTSIRSILAVVVAVGFAAAGVAQDKPPAQKFEPKFELNKKFYQSVTTDVDQTVKVQGGNDVKLKHSQTFLFRWEPTKQDGKKWTVKLVIEGVKLKVDVANNPINYDSTAEQPNAGNPGLNEFLKNLKDSEFTITYGEGMAVEKVEGQENLLKNLGAANQQMEQLLKRILTTEALKEMSDPLAGLTPPAEKNVGDKWDKTTPLKLGPIGDYDRKLGFEYKGKDKDGEFKDMERVVVTAAVTYKPPSAEADGLLFRIKAGDLTTQNPKAGYYIFDGKTGQLKKAELSVTMTGSLTVAVGTTETVVNLNQTQTTTVLTGDKSFVPEKK